MSVLVRKRDLSKIEYVYNFIKLYEFAIDDLSRVAKRKRPFLTHPIYNIMKDIFNDINSVSNDYFYFGIKLKSKPEQAQQIIDKLLSLQYPLLNLWSIERYRTKKMVDWAKKIDKEIELISLMGGLLYDNSDKHMFILDYKKINEMNFLKNMRRLEQFIYSKVIALPSDYRESHGYILRDLVDVAFYNLVEANRFIPTNKRMYIKRKEHIETAMDCVNKMQIPSVALFIKMKYGNDVMCEWSELINKEIKLLNGLKKSDKERFGNLK